MPLAEDPGVIGDAPPLLGDAPAPAPASMLVARPVRDTFSFRDNLPLEGGAANEKEARPDDMFGTGLCTEEAQRPAHECFRRVCVAPPTAVLCVLALATPEAETRASESVAWPLVSTPRLTPCVADGDEAQATQQTGGDPDLPWTAP